MDHRTEVNKFKGSKHSIELAVIAVLSLCIFIIAQHFDVLEKIVGISQQYENLEIDEIITVVIFLIFASIIYSWRRHLELNKAHKEIIEKNRALEETLREVRELKSILPICTVCNKIRDDEGYWHKVEAYISDHTNTEFSHGLCPKCLNKTYPQLFEK